MEHKLASYRKKRDFTVTNEPEGNVAPSDRGALRYSVQKHAARAVHFDLRLELGGVALSWAIPKGPSFSVSDKRLAVRVEDHPIDYMDFEGTIPKGEYGGGTVMLWDEGTWTPRSDPEKGLKEGSLKFRLDGERLKGNWALVRMKGDEKQEPWLLIKERDGYAAKTAGVSRFTRGIRSGRSMKEIADSANANPFGHADVMLARLCDSLPRGKEWLYEIKYDGHRTLAFSEKGKTRLITRNGHDCTDSFPLAAEAVSKTLNGRSAVLDGEMIVTDENGLSDFGAIQSYAGGKGGGNLGYVLFDLLALDGEDLRARPLLSRKQKLKALLSNAPAPISYSEHTEKMTAPQLKKLRASGIEGVVVKRADSPYTAGKNGDWLKLKFRNACEFAIGGYTVSETGELRAVLVGCFEGENLVYAGKVGTGFTDSSRAALKKEFEALGRGSSPFSDLPRNCKKDAHWVEPVLAAQVEFAEITSSGLLRQASFKGLRLDKPAREIVAERPAPAGNSAQKPHKNPKNAEKPHTVTKNAEKSHTVTKNAETPHRRRAEKATSSAKKDAEKPTRTVEKPTRTIEKATHAIKKDAERAEVCSIAITHPDKTMYPRPKFTKLDVAEYYAAVAPRMLPYLKDRLLSLVCCPAGIEGEKFFRRHLDGTFEGVGFWENGGENDFFVKSEKGVVSLAQYNALEFHVRGCRKGTDDPDIMVFDLDPDEGLPLAAVRRGVRELKNALDGLGLRSFLKTSGGKGYHIVVPFRTAADGETFRAFAKEVARLMECAYPDLFTANMSKKLRAGKIFLDWQRNSPGATSAAPYTLRARPGAPVSAPLSWDELGKVAPAAVTLKNALRRLEKPDPWEDFFDVKAAQSLNVTKKGGRRARRP